MNQMMRWMLLGVLMLGMIPSTGADEPAASNDPTRFEDLLKRHPNDPALVYNLGTAQYQRGDYGKAAESLQRAVASSSPPLQGRASYNLGNTHYRLGHTAEPAAPNQAVVLYQNALEDYRFAMRQDPKDLDAKYNYELVEHRLHALKTQQAQQPPAKEEPQQANQPSSQAQQADAQPTQGEQTNEPHKPAAQAQQQPQGQQAQAAQQPGPQEAEQHPQTATAPQNMSQQQAIWILDTLKHEERGALPRERQGPARESNVEQDW